MNSRKPGKRVLAQIYDNIANQSLEIITRTHRRGLYLHASAVCFSGRALIFLGHATAGKSTISQLLSLNCPVIADDKVWVSIGDDDEWKVRGVISDTGINRESEPLLDKNEYQLHSAYRIFQSINSIASRISPQMTCRYLMDAVFEIPWQRKDKDLEKKKEWFREIADISRKISGWEFLFSIDAGIIKIIEKNFLEEYKVE